MSDSDKEVVPFQTSVMAPKRARKAGGNASTQAAEPAPFNKDKDVIIAVMGITGAGKSTFISRLVENEVVPIGHDLRSYTVASKPYAFLLDNGQRVYLLDTPGFDDTTRSDTDVLKDIAGVLGKLYSDEVKLSGIIYLHRITDNRMGGSALRNLHMFKKLCGKNYYHNVILATTMWEKLQYDEELGERNEKQLISEHDWWGGMIENGSTVYRHYDTTKSAVSIIKSLLSRAKPEALNIQREMVTEKKDLQDTAAGREVEKDLVQLREKYDKSIKELQAEQVEALKDQDERLARALQQQEQALTAKLEQASQAQKDLKVSLEQVMKESAEKYARLAAESEKRREQDKREHRKALEAQQEKHEKARREDREAAEKAQYQSKRDMQQAHQELVDQMENNWLRERKEQQDARMREQQEQEERRKQDQLRAQEQYRQLEESNKQDRLRAQEQYRQLGESNKQDRLRAQEQFQQMNERNRQDQLRAQERYERLEEKSRSDLSDVREELRSQTSEWRQEVERWRAASVADSLSDGHSSHTIPSTASDYESDPVEWSSEDEDARSDRSSKPNMKAMGSGAGLLMGLAGIVTLNPLLAMTGFGVAAGASFS